MIHAIAKEMHRHSSAPSCRVVLLAGLLFVVALSGCSDPQSKPEQKQTCPQGSEGCPCYSNQTCDRPDDGVLQCVDGTCQPKVATVGQSVRISAQDARACDVLVEGPEGALRGVEFSEGVRGQHIERNGRVALSLAARDDAALAPEVAVLKLPADAPDFAVDKVECFDRLGRALKGADATLR